MKKAKRLIAAAFAALTLGLGFAAVQDAQEAHAAATSPKTNGCYIEWWNTAWNARCDPATKTGQYQAHVAYQGQPDHNGSWVKKSAGWKGVFDSAEAAHAVQGANTYVNYKG